MKKLALLILTMYVSIIGFSQQRVPIDKTLRSITKKIPVEIVTDEVVNMGIDENPYVSNVNRGMLGEKHVGSTYYDQQSNASLSNRIHFYDDWSVGAVWTRGITEAPTFEDRGTGYRFFDGSTWHVEPDIRVEDERTGWPSYAPLGEDGEIIVAHLDDGLKISTRPDKGTGDWTFQTLESPESTSLKWPRMITSGSDNNIIHILANSYTEYAGQERALLYYRSQDAGETWDIEAQIIEGTDSSHYSQINSDSYVWADPVDGTIAFLVSSTWYTDLFMMKSTDNGDTWEKTIIWEHPYPFFNWDTTVADTFYCVDNSASITLDNEGKAHVAFGITRAMYLEPGMYNIYFPYTDGVGYWNEDMPTFSNNLNALCPDTDNPESELIENYNLVGWTQDVNGNGEIDFLDDLFSYNKQHGISTMPSLGADDYGNIVLAYSSTTETYEAYYNDTFNLKHIWVRTRSADGEWSCFSDLNTNIIHLFDECIYPVVAQHVGDCGFTHLLYQADLYPGVALQSAHEYVENKLYVAWFDNCTDINEQQSNQPSFTLSQNIPNPATNHTSIEVKTETIGVVNLTIANVLGQVVHHESVDNNSHKHTFDIDVSSFDSGIYFYTIKIGKSSVTKKMLVK